MSISSNDPPLAPGDERDDIPGSVRNYFLGRPDGPGKIDLESHKPPVQIDRLNRPGEFRGLGDLVLAEGWSNLERWGVWSNGNRATLYVRNSFVKNSAFQGGDSTAEIVIAAWGAVSGSHHNVVVRFVIGATRNEFVFAWPDLVTAQIRLPIPADLAGKAIIRVVLDIEASPSPNERTGGVSQDLRRLGIGIKSIEVRAGQGASRLPPEKPNKLEGPIPLRDMDMPANDQPIPAVAPVAIGFSSRFTAQVIAMTMVYNEGDMLGRWLAHYGHHLGERNLIVIDHGSDDGSTDHIGAAGRIMLPRGPFDDGQRTEFVNGLQKDLFHYYDAVIYTDCDEFLVPDPRRFSSLSDYIDKMTTDCVRAVGVNLMHIRDREEPLRARQGFLDQRGYCQFYIPECKPLITRTPMNWHTGFHACDKKALLDPDLLLVHTKLADYDSALARLAVTRGIQWSERALRSWGAHQRAGDESIISGFDARERFLRAGGQIENLCPPELAKQTNERIETSSDPLWWRGSVPAPLSRVPEWLIGAV